MAIAATSSALSSLSPYEALRRINGTNGGANTATEDGDVSSSMVSISPQARQRLAAEAQDRTTEAAAVAAGEVPLQQLALPDWYAEYAPAAMNLSNGTVSSGGSGSDLQQDRSEDMSAYSQRVASLYQQVLQDNGVGTTVSHYQATHEDKALSQDLRRQFHQALANDPQAQQLRLTLGIGLPDLSV